MINMKSITMFILKLLSFIFSIKVVIFFESSNMYVYTELLGRDIKSKSSVFLGISVYISFLSFLFFNVIISISPSMKIFILTIVAVNVSVLYIFLPSYPIRGIGFMLMYSLAMISNFILNNYFDNKVKMKLYQ